MLIEVIGPNASDIPAKIQGMRLATFWERFLRSVAIQADQNHKRCAHKLIKRFRLKFDGLSPRQIRKRRTIR
jgi:hypothetical protein